jgi:hypothetical protein
MLMTRKKNQSTGEGLLSLPWYRGGGGMKIPTTLLFIYILDVYKFIILLSSLF